MSTNVRVVASNGRGPSTIYTLNDGEKTWTAKRSEVPVDVFKQWRNDQAARCMKIKRESAPPKVEKQVNQLKEEKLVAEVGVQTEGSLVESASTQTESGSQPLDPASGRSGIEAKNLITCKICMEKRVGQLLIPCTHLVFCTDCLTKALRRSNTCPICRVSIKDYIAVQMIE